jgi:hypothetical protein
MAQSLGLFGSSLPAPAGKTLLGMDQDSLGILAASLKDALAYFHGDGDQATNLLPAIQQANTRSQLRDLYTGMSSADPTQRQGAYTKAQALGVDVTPFQKNAAAAALPKLMDNLRPQPNLATPIVTPSPVLQPDAYKVGVASGAFQQPATVQPSLSDALATTGNPELSAQMAPDIIKQTLDQQQKAVRTLSPAELQTNYGIDPAALAPGTVPQVDAYGNLKFIKGGDTKSKAAIDQQIDLENRNPNLAIARGNLALSQERLNYDQANKAIDPKAVDLGVNYFMAHGGKFPPTARSPALQNAIMSAADDRMSAQGMSMDDLVRKGQNLTAGGKALTAFDTGKQGDTVRSLNVSVSHLETLRNLGNALQNGDVRAINAAKQRFAEEFGVAAPTNFDAAKAIVADEVAKGVIGGQSAQSDRETLAASLRRSGSPQAIDGAINTFQDLLGGQLRGLRQQYKSSTGRDDFNQKLFPDTLNVLDPPMGKLPPRSQSLPRLNQHPADIDFLLKKYGQ